MTEAKQIIAALNLAPHPEGGWYRQTWITAGPGRADERPVGTAIYFLLQGGKPSHWHCVDAVQIWYFHAGAPLALSLPETDAEPATELLIGAEVLAGHCAQGLVAGRAQLATGRWSVAPSAPAFGLKASPLHRRGGSREVRLKNVYLCKEKILNDCNGHKIGLVTDACIG